MDITSMYNSVSNIDYLVQMYMQIETEPRANYAAKRDILSDKKTVLSTLDSKLSALNSKSEKFMDTITDYFAAKKTESSDEEFLAATANQYAQLGTHSFTVEQLAKADTRVSMQYDDDTTSFNSINQDQTFSITISHPTDEDEYNRETIDITIDQDTLDLSDSEVLQSIADTINIAMSDAVDAETINNDEVVRASVVSEEPGKSRLVLKSSKTGYNNRLEFTDSNRNLLNRLEITDNSEATGTSGGYITEVGTSVNDSMLSSKFTMDGLTFYRDSNQVNDALTGVTLNLYNSFAETKTLTVSTDTEKVTEDVNAFLESYNEVITFLTDEGQIDPDTKERGALADDVIYRQIISQVRTRSNSVVSTANSNYTTLYSIGIQADSSGKLSITDSEKFTEALENNSQNVSEIFNADDGVATKLNQYLENYVKAGGTIDSSQENIDNTVTRMNDRLSLMDEMLLRRENQLRTEFARIQDAMTQLQSQQSFFSSFSSMY